MSQRTSGRPCSQLAFALAPFLRLCPQLGVGRDRCGGPYVGVEACSKSSVISHRFQTDHSDALLEMES